MNSHFKKKQLEPMTPWKLYEDVPFLDEVVLFYKTDRNIKYVNELRLSFIRVVSISAIPRYG